jgi:pimeloyl-ACP methyl ester carboxylesterase
METLSTWIDGAQVYASGRTGPLIVMIHGWPDTYRLWESTVQALHPRWRCVRFDLPGYGGTGLPPTKRGPTVDTVLDRIRTIADHYSPSSKIVLLVHDWGAAYGYAYACRFPERVAAIVGVDVGDITRKGYFKSLGCFEQLVLLSYQAVLLIAYAIGGDVGDRMTRKMASVLGSPRLGQHIHHRMNYPYLHYWRGAFRGFEFHALKQPILYLFGRRKPLQFHSPSWLVQLRGARGSAVVEFPGGHWLMSDDPAGFSQTIDNWLSSCEGLRDVRWNESLPSGDGSCR